MIVAVSRLNLRCSLENDVLDVDAHTMANTEPRVNSPAVTKNPDYNKDLNRRDLNDCPLHPEFRLEF